METIEEWDIDKYINTFKSQDTLIFKVFSKLKDGNWHCRDCANKVINSKQYAGGGGIQGLQRGSKGRPGLKIITELAQCFECQETVKCDRWTGEYKTSNVASSIPKSLQEKILVYYNYTDCIEQRKRNSHELIIDHRFPMERWGEAEEKNSPTMSEAEIKEKFQLLKKDDSGNHNLLKSRACERCIETGKRGYPLGIKFYYEGDENWPNVCPSTGELAKRGCIGCGWYDLNKWRYELNKLITESYNTD